MKAYSRIHEKIEGKLVIVGDGPLRNEIKNIIKENRLEGGVELLGWQNDIKKIMSSFNLLVVPSLSEGCPNVILEALGCETPCIGSDIPEIREVLMHNELLFKPNNPEDMAKRIIHALENHKRVKKLCSERKKDFIFDWRKACIEVIQSQEYE